MTFTLDVPPEYGWVLISCAVLPYILSWIIAEDIMAARTRLEVDLPNLYAVPGVHKHATEFNRVQRGHQNYLETLPSHIVLTLVGGLRHPYACAMGGIFHALGSYLYAKGYADMKLDIKMARHQKGGPIKYVGVLTTLICTIQLAYQLIQSA